MARPLRIMIDARMLIGRFSGIGRFVTRLVEHLVDCPNIQVVALCGREATPGWLAWRGVDIVTSSFQRRDRTAARRALWEERHLGRLIHDAHADVFHATWNSGVPVFCPVPAVLTIHDLIPWFHPAAHFATRAQRLGYWYAIRASVRRAAIVTTVSDYVRHQVLSTLHPDPKRVVTVYNGVDAPASALDSPTGFGLREHETATEAAEAAPYVLYVGGYERRKNLAAVFRAIEQYWATTDDVLDLRLTGDACRLGGDASLAYRALTHPSRVRFLGTIDDAELSRQYAHARALLLLSRDEGFGLPVLEAMAHGCPVVAAAKASLPEIVSDAGILVDPEDIPSVCAAIRSFVHSPRRREAFIHRGFARARAFGWDVTASRMIEIYERLGHGSTMASGTLSTSDSSRSSHASTSIANLVST